jgi:hypothetical protein
MVNNKPLAAFNALSRLRNLGLPCWHCNKPINSLGEHLRQNGLHHCRFMPVAQRELEAADAEWDELRAHIAVLGSLATGPE